MNRSVLSAALLVTLSGGMALAQQQTAPPPPDGQGPPMHQFHHKPNPQREADRIAHKLNLTPDQTAKLAPIFANRDQQMEAIHNNGQLTQQDAHMQMRALEKSTHDQLASVLTPDQLQQLKQMRHMHGGPHGPMQGPPPPPQGI